VNGLAAWCRSRLQGAVDLRVVRAWASYLVARLGPVGVAGAALAAISVGLAVYSTTVVAPRLAADTLRAQQLRAELRRAAYAVPARPRGTESLLPALESAPHFAEAVHDEARRAGVELLRADYRTPDTGDAQVRRLQVVLPARGDYAAIKRWITRLLAAHPACALDELSLQRADAAEAPATVLQARVVLSLYMRSAP
jgi:hypothetical protein